MDTAACRRWRRYFAWHSNSTMNVNALIASALLAVVLLSLSGCGNSSQDPLIDQLISSKFGTRHYEMDFRGTRVGVLQTSVAQSSYYTIQVDNRFWFASTQDTQLEVRQSLNFSAEPPFELIEATHERYAAPNTDPYETHRIARSGDSLVVYRLNQPDSKLASDFGLREYLGLEIGISKEDLRAGDSVSATSLDVGRGQLGSQKWVVEDYTSDSIQLRSADGSRSTLSRSSEGFELISSTDRSGFTLQRIDTASESMLELHVPIYAIPSGIVVDRPIERQAELKLLELQVAFSNQNAGPWEQLLTDSDNLVLTREGVLLNRSKSKTSQFTPRNRDAQLEQVKQLASSATSGLRKEEDKLSALVSFTHEYVQYAETPDPRSVVATLENRQGDCSEIANLFSALANASGLAARTVYGLAYDAQSSTFRIHAWNEVLLNSGRARLVDATWNQLVADPTHIEFPNGYVHDVLPTLENMRLIVVRTEYALKES